MITANADSTGTRIASTPSRAVVVDTSDSANARLRPLPVDAVQLNDTFWAPRIRTNREVTIPAQYRYLVETNRLRNFERLSGKSDAPFDGIYFNDSDVYKWLEAASWSLATTPDPKMETMVDGVIATIGAAQRPDGYLNTYFAAERADQRWTVPDLHELYCAGHLFQAAVAHVRATGKTSLLDIATRFADHIVSQFGPESESKRFWTDGHPEIEMALVELGRAAGNPAYVEQARYFTDARGHNRLPKPYDGRFGAEYHQDHVPLREMDEVAGHAVRMLYLMCGAADLLAESEYAELQAAMNRLWSDMTQRKIYVSGGLGGRYEGEAFGESYELPNARAYTETCAAIASVMWNWRLLGITGDARYADLMEHTLYNAVLPGLSLDGQDYFYQNPLQDNGTHRRQPWFGCACCPPNVARMLASLSGYVASVDDDGVWVHLYAAGTTTAHLPSGQEVALVQRSAYPWDGAVSIEVRSAGTYALNLRVPGWATGGAVTIAVNDVELAGPMTPGSYTRVMRDWRSGDIVTLDMPMPVRQVVSHPRVTENTGQTAFLRGPLLYCLEATDQPGTDLDLLTVSSDADIASVHRSDLLGGVTTLTMPALAQIADPAWESALYRELPVERDNPAYVRTTVRAVPYYAWANRAAGPMRVWIRSSPAR